MTMTATKTYIAPAFRTLDDEQLRKAVPSAYATQPWERMSHRYKMVPTSEVIALLGDRGFRPTRAIQSSSRIEGKGLFTKHMIRFRHDDYLNALIPIGQEVPELVLTNSHDGTSAYKFLSGIFRLVCTNGLMVQTSDFGSVSVRHSGGKDFEQQVIDATYEVIEDAPRSLAQIATWKQIEVKPEHQAVLAEEVLKVRGDGIELSPSAVLSPRRPADRSADLWTTANRIQENLIKGGVLGVSPTNGGPARTRAVKSVNADVRINQALWSLTERMGQILGS